VIAAAGPGKSGYRPGTKAGMNSARGPCAVLVRGEGTRPLETLHAKMLLGRTTWPVAQVADALGFTEPAHFSNTN